MPEKKEKKLIRCSVQEGLKLPKSSQEILNEVCLNFSEEEGQQFRINGSSSELLAECEIMNFFESIFEPKAQEYKTILAVSKDEMYLAERIQVSYSPQLSDLCHRSKNLYNLGNYLTRLRYFFLNPPPNSDYIKTLKSKIMDKQSESPFSSFASFLDEFKRVSQNYIDKINEPSGKEGYHSLDPNDIMEEFGIDESKVIPRKFKSKKDLKKYYQVGVLMFYEELWQLIRYTDEYKALGGQTAQQTLKLLMSAWDSYFESDEKDKNIPRYKSKNGEQIVIFTNQYIRKGKQYISNRSSKTITEIIFPMKANIPPIKTTIPFEIIQHVRIVPRGNIYIFEVVYKKNKKQTFVDLNRVIGIDLGANNLLAIANNIGDHPIIVKGGVVKLANFLAERQTGHLKSQRDNLINQVIELKKKSPKHHKANIIEMEKQIKALNSQITPAWTKRNNRIQDYFHKISRQIIEYCIDNNIGTIAIGYNEEWKQNLRKERRLGKKTRKKFVLIPFYKLFSMLKYKGELEGIEILKVKEYIEEGGEKKGSSQTCCYCGRKRKANRVKRGFYKCDRCGLEINADINGAINHAKWGKEDSFKKYTMREYMNPPIPLKTVLATA